MKKTALIILSLSLIGQLATAQIIVKIKPACPKVVIVKPTTHKTGHIWVDGHWNWNANQKRYVWKEGHWVKQRNGKVYVLGHWKNSKGGHVWVPGHWRKRAKF